MRTSRTLSWRAPGLFLLVLAGAAGAGRLHADPKPLPPALEERINKAIDDGVKYLRSTQAADGTWSLPMERFRIGYTALPGLTLLECGKEPDDPCILKAARAVRAAAPQLDETYEISLSILFLDRLGDPKDRKLVQSLALRLIAGQTPTGGWTYKCPRLLPAQELQLLAILQKLPASDPFRPILVVEPRSPGETPNPLTPSTEKPEPEKPSPGSGPDKLPPSRSIPQEGDGPPLTRAAPSLTRPVLCIKMLDHPPEQAPVPVKAEPVKPVAQGPVVIPAALQGLPVLNDPAKLQMVDPENKPMDTMFGTTDNSNTQFAMLAIWAARRHDIPTRRTLNLIARRFHTSQIGDGGWNYYYRRGGAPTELRSPSMTCVGLLGLAIAHGLANDQADGNPPPQTVFGPGKNLPPDEAIVRGFLALQPYIGEPTGRMEALPHSNLYFLWSVERVAVLYGLKTIGLRDWYRWGAEVLVANQAAGGFWDKGGYHAAAPTVNTCLALLFLKRVNLVGDLQDKLAFKPEDLSAILITRTAPKKKTPGPTPAPENRPENDPKTAPTTDRSILAPAPPAGRGAKETEEPASGGSRRLLTWLLPGVVLLLLLAGGGVALFVVFRRESREGNKSARKSAKSRGSKSVKGKPRSAH